MALASLDPQNSYLTVARFLHLGTGAQIYSPGAYIYPLPRFLNLATGFPYLATSTDDAVQ